MNRPDVYTVVLEQVVGFIPSMLPGHRYTVETMCGNALWDPLNRYQRRTAGQVIALAVTRGDLPLAFANTGRKSTKMYQLP